MKIASKIAIVAASLALTLSASQSHASLVFNQTFETDTAGVLTPAGNGTVTRVASGTGGINTDALNGGAFYAQVTQSGDPGNESGPYTQFDGYRSVWPGSFTSSVDVYLNPTRVGSGQLGTGGGFDFSTAASQPDGNHRRDFIFHVTQDTSTGNLQIGASNNTNFAPDESLESGAHLEVGTAGWYTLQSRFYDNGSGVLAVDMNVLNDLGAVLFTTTLSDASDIIGTTVGGNRYGWFTNIDVNGGISIDNLRLSVDNPVVPEPATMSLVALGMSGAAFLRRRKQAVR